MIHDSTGQLVHNIIMYNIVYFLFSRYHSFLYARPKTGHIMESPCPSVRPSTIACERDILKTACRIDFTF